MKTIDFIIAIPVIWGIYKGFTKGLISEVAQFAALVLGIILGSRLSYLLSGFLIDNVGLSEKFVPVVSFSLIFLGVLIGIYFLSKALTNAAKAVSLGWLNTVGGMILGGLKFLFLIGILLQVIISNDTNAKLISNDVRENSVLLKPTLQITSFFSPYLKKALFDTDININSETEEDKAVEE